MLGMTQPCTSLDSESLQAHVTPACRSESRFVPHFYSQSRPSFLRSCWGALEKKNRVRGQGRPWSSMPVPGPVPTSPGTLYPSPGGSAGKACSQFTSDLSRDISEPAFIFLSSICLRSHQTESKPWVRAQPPFVLSLSGEEGVSSGQPHTGAVMDSE